MNVSIPFSNEDEPKKGDGSGLGFTIMEDILRIVYRGRFFLTLRHQPVTSKLTEYKKKRVVATLSSGCPYDCTWAIRRTAQMS